MYQRLGPCVDNPRCASRWLFSSDEFNVWSPASNSVESTIFCIGILLSFSSAVGKTFTTHLNLRTYRTLQISSRLPFYYPIKTLFLLYLVLPQTRGSSFIYISYLQPFFRTHESDIDAVLASLKSRAYSFIQERARMLWEQIVAIVAQSPSSSGVAGANPGSSSTSAPPPTVNDPISGPVQMLGGLWRTYGPSIVASGAALLRQSQESATARGSGAGGQPATSGGGFFSGFAASTSSVNLHNLNDTQSVLERRQHLEAELASLQAFSSTSSPGFTPPQEGAPPFPIPVHHGSSSYTPTPLGSSTDLRSRGGNGSSPQFEEIEVPSDVEGYDVGGVSTPQGQRRPQSTENQGQKPDAARRSSWFFGWGGSPVAGASGSATTSPSAERIKEE